MNAHIPPISVSPYRLLIALSVTLIVNIPFGYWRAYAKRNKRRFEWFLAIHAPVPLIAILRKWSGVSLSAEHVALIALFVAMYFIGQRLGGKIHDRLASSGCIKVGRNLVHDVLRVYRISSSCRIQQTRAMRD